jgi:hypothetical protein
VLFIEHFTSFGNATVEVQVAIKKIIFRRTLVAPLIDLMSILPLKRIKHPKSFSNDHVRAQLHTGVFQDFQ